MVNQLVNRGRRDSHPPNNDYTVCIILEIQTVPFRIRSRSLFPFFRPAPFISTAYVHLSSQRFPVYTDCINRVKAYRPGFALRALLYLEHVYKSRLSLHRGSSRRAGM